MASSLYMVSAGQTAEPLDINQVVEVLQEPAGATESGGYFCAGVISATGQVLSIYLQTLSRVSTPVSCTPTLTSSGPGVGTATPTVGHLGSNGFQLFKTDTTAPQGNGYYGGQYTVQF